jgi:hypothetical protein
MKLQTFYQIYYKHRILKANIFHKIYLLIIIPIRFIFNSIIIEKKINLDYLGIINPTLFDKNLNYLFEYFNTDKGYYFYNQYSKSKKKEKIQGHSYVAFYEKYFKIVKNNKLNILELGSFKGAAAAAFFFYFPNSKIYSGDIFPDLFNFFSKRIFNFKVDSGSEKSINSVILNNDVKYDIIIEDASHFLKDQIISLFLLFKKLKSDGFFIIEELDFPDTRKDMNLLNEKPTLREILYCIKENKNFHSNYINNIDRKYFLENFQSINIYKGRTNEIAFIKKKVYEKKN